MIENLIENDDYIYIIYDKYACNKNIDRIKYFENIEKNSQIKALSAGYHLDKETQKKTGGIFFFNISDQKKLIPIDTENILLDYGILDIKFSKNNSLIFTANSDYSYTIFNLNNNSQNKIYLDNDNINEEKKKITNDVIEKNSKEEKIYLGANDGNIFIEDLQTSKNILKIPNAHEYGIWSIYLLDEGNIFLSGGEDAQIKIWDIRCEGGKTDYKNINKNNKTYQSSINFIDKLKCDSTNNTLITGSYDEKMVLFDIRNFHKELKSIKTEHSIWDMKQSIINDKNLLLMASIYEGFNIWEIELNNDYNMKHILRLPVTKNKDIFHGTIVYGVDIKSNKNDIDILSCSFYDNLMMYWNYSKN